MFGYCLESWPFFSCIVDPAMLLARMSCWEPQGLIWVTPGWRPALLAFADLRMTYRSGWKPLLVWPEVASGCFCGPQWLTVWVTSLMLLCFWRLQLSHSGQWCCDPLWKIGRSRCWNAWGPLLHFSAVIFRTPPQC